MTEDSKMAIIANDLDSLCHRIEELQAHPALTDAGIAVDHAKRCVEKARREIHQEHLAKRHGTRVVDPASGRDLGPSD